VIATPLGSSRVKPLELHRLKSDLVLYHTILQDLVALSSSEYFTVLIPPRKREQVVIAPSFMLY